MAARYQPHNSTGGWVVDRPEGPQHLTGQQCGLSYAPLGHGKPLASISHLLTGKLLYKAQICQAQDLSLVEKKTESHGLRGKVTTLKSLSKWVLQG